MPDDKESATRRQKPEFDGFGGWASFDLGAATSRATARKRIDACASTHTHRTHAHRRIRIARKRFRGAMTNLRKLARRASTSTLSQPEYYIEFLGGLRSLYGCIRVESWSDHTGPVKGPGTCCG